MLNICVISPLYVIIYLYTFPVRYPHASGHVNFKYNTNTLPSNAHNSFLPIYVAYVDNII